MQKIFGTFALAKMKEIFSTFLLFVVVLGLIAISNEGQADSRKTTENPRGFSIESAEAECSFIASTGCVLSATGAHSTFNDESAVSLAVNALLPGNSNTQFNTPSQLFRLRAMFAAQMQHFISGCRAEQNSFLSFTPNAIRYSYGYYIYELAHILI